MQTMSLIKFEKGGGGLIGVRHNCVLTNFAFVTHALESTKTGTKYPTACFLRYHIAVTDPVPEEVRESTQYARVGNVPLAYTQQLGEQDPQRDATRTGGFLPSVDGENGATEGPFLTADGERGIWENAEAAMFFEELRKLAEAEGFSEQYAALVSRGVNGLDGIEVYLDEKGKPKGKKAAQEAALSGKATPDRTVIVPSKVNRWPWQQATAAAAAAAAAPMAIATPAPVAVAVPTPVAAPAPVIAAAPAPAAAATNDPFDAQTLALIKTAAAATGGMIARSGILAAVFTAAANIDVASKMQVMQRVNNPAWLDGQAAAGKLMIDAAGNVMVLV